MELTIDGMSEKKRVAVVPQELVIAGWTGRDAAALEAHIVELEALGVARPKSVPIYYRVGASLLTTSPTIDVTGRDSSGEAEVVLWRLDGRLFVGIGSDHTDRQLETLGITLSKQVCPKPVSPVLWAYDDVAPHWDRLVLRSRVPGESGFYQEGSVGLLRRPDELLARYQAEHGPLPDGSAMFCGTLAVHGGIRLTPGLELELEDPVLGRRLSHRYEVRALPIAEA